MCWIFVLQKTSCVLQTGLRIPQFFCTAIFPTKGFHSCLPVSGHGRRRHRYYCSHPVPSHHDIHFRQPWSPSGLCHQRSRQTQAASAAGLATKLLFGNSSPLPLGAPVISGTPVVRFTESLPLAFDTRKLVRLCCSRPGGLAAALGALKDQEVTIVEVGPRDGLQNERRTLEAAAKVAFIQHLAEAGLRHIEVGAFVSPKWVPQMADTKQVLERLPRQPDVTYSVLVPNLKGYELARSCGVSEVAVFAAASESFSLANANCSIGEALNRIEPVLAAATKDGVRVRGYVSCVLGCPYEGGVSTSAVAHVTQRLLRGGCYEVSLGDTIGVGTPGTTAQLLGALKDAGIPMERLAAHFHDTYGQALVNVLVALQLGIRTVDSSAAGLGGCPYAKNSTGNLATEEVVYMLESLGVKTGVDLRAVVAAGKTICTLLGRSPSSRVNAVMGADSPLSKAVIVQKGRDDDDEQLR